MDRPTSNTQIIIFSKHRTLQLRSLLKSLRHYSDIEENEIAILYIESPDTPYDDLKSEFGCHFVQQKNFLEDLRTIVDHSTADYVCWMVDDLIFKDSFSMRSVESVLDTNSSIDCFSLRLGNNIESGKPPRFSEVGENVLTWETGRGLGKLWNFFWEASSSVYRKTLVSEYLRKCNPHKVSYPNPFESHYYARMPSHHRPKHRINRLLLNLRFLLAKKTNMMACFKQSKCFTLGINLVATRELEHIPLASPVELHQKMKQGFLIDYRSLRGVENIWPNTGQKYFSLHRDN
jgi:hypothetical protein